MHVLEEHHEDGNFKAICCLWEQSFIVLKEHLNSESYEFSWWEQQSSQTSLAFCLVLIGVAEVLNARTALEQEGGCDPGNIRFTEHLQ